MRTAAVSAAVTKYLAAPGSRVLALLGSGVQAKAHLEALSHVCKFDEVRVWSRTPEHAENFAREHGAVAVDAESAVRGADVVVTATNAREPILKGVWLKRGAHVNAVGSPRPTWRELDDEAMANSLIVDSREAVLTRHSRRDPSGEDPPQRLPSGSIPPIQEVGCGERLSGHLGFGGAEPLGVRRQPDRPGVPGAPFCPGPIV
jgi:ornithine cyclodeaminase/alanine dehydrogenase-like protein (mu-crystallin family)